MADTIGRIAIYAHAPVGTGAPSPVDQQSYKMEAGQLWRQFVIAGIANIGIASLGYSMGWTSPINGKLRNVTESPLPEPITDNQEAWIGSTLTLGAIVGPFIGGFVASIVGRKWGILSAAVPLFVGGILIAVATNLAYIYAGRVLWGVATGMMFTVSPMYCAEIATDDERGALGSILQVFISIGFLLVYGIGPFVSYTTVAYVGVGIVAVFAIAFVLMPETPIYHLTKSDRESAARCLATIRGRSTAGVEEELSKMAVEVQASMENTATFADVFRGGNFKALYISCALIFFHQFSGISPVLFYTANIFDAAGSSLDSDIATIIIGVVQLVASCITPFVVDRLGRRILMMISTCGTAVGLGLLGFYFILAENENPLAESLGFLPLFSLVLFMVTFCVGLGILPFAIMGELLPIEVKAKAASIANAFYWILSFFITRYFIPIANQIGIHVVFWIFAANCVCGFFFTFFLVPETKGKSFQEIQDMLAGRTSKKEKSGF